MEHKQDTNTDIPVSNIDMQQIVQEGYALKKSSQLLGGWKRRYLQLTSDKQLSYYTDETMTVKRVPISLDDITKSDIKVSSKSFNSKHHGFVPYIMDIHNKPTKTFVSLITDSA